MTKTGAMSGGHWSVLRGHRLTFDLNFECQPLRIVTSNTLVFRRFSSIRDEMARGCYHATPPLSRGVCRKPFGLARAKPLENRNAHKYISSTLNLTLPNSDKQLCCQIPKCCTSKQLMLYVPFFPRIVQVCTLVWFTENRCVPVSMSHCHLPPSTLPFWRHKCPTNRA